ncbi:MAG: hypothetical protein R3C49_27075 [Planctomycetaceae bacterium]
MSIDLNELRALPNEDKELIASLLLDDISRDRAAGLSDLEWQVIRQRSSALKRNPESGFNSQQMWEEVDRILQRKAGG